MSVYVGLVSALHVSRTGQVLSDIIFPTLFSDSTYYAAIAIFFADVLKGIQCVWAGSIRTVVSAVVSALWASFVDEGSPLFTHIRNN